MNPKKKETETVISQDAIDKMSFEEAYAALKASTERLEGEEIDLEATLKEYARASALARHCAKMLDAAEEQIRVLTESGGVIQVTGMGCPEPD